MKKATLLLSLILVVAFTGVCNADQNDLTILFIPASLNQAYGFPVKMWNDKVIIASTKEVMKGWHTTCIGASFVDKEPKRLPPLKVVQTPPPLPPPVIAKPPVVVSPVTPPPIVVKPPVVVPPVIPPPVVVEKPKPKLVLDPVPFDINKTNINPFGAKVLDKNAAIIKEYPNIKIEVQGHTDDTGSVAANKVISEKRAKSCEKYLMDKFNIADERMETKGFGSSRPIADNNTREGREKNRRVEFLIIE